MATKRVHAVRCYKFDCVPRHCSVGRRNLGFLTVFAVVAALLLSIKTLYPGGSNDYYNHYFYYYVDVIRNGSLMPNEAWYHFFYSKGLGLYFLGMLLSDPLAPQLVTGIFTFAAALAVWLISEPFAPYHAAALVLVIGGIWLAQRTRAPR